MNGRQAFNLTVDPCGCTQLIAVSPSRSEASNRRPRTGPAAWLGFVVSLVDR
jgi:hypothetical protein